MRRAWRPAVRHELLSERLALRQVDQRNPQFRPLAAAEPRRGLDDGHFEGRPHDALEEMTAAGRAVAQAQHRVHVQAGLAVVAGGDVAQEAEALALAVDLDRLI